MSSSGIKYTTQWWLLVLIPAIPTIRVYNALQVSPLGTALSHQVPAGLHDQNHTPVSARSHQESSSHSDAHAPDAHWGPPKVPSATVTQTAHWSTRPVSPSHASPAWRKRVGLARPTTPPGVTPTTRRWCPCRFLSRGATCLNPSPYGPD